MMEAIQGLMPKRRLELRDYLVTTGWVTAALFWVWMATFIISGLQYQEIDRMVNGRRVVAQTSVKAEVMVATLDDLLRQMERLGLTSGYNDWRIKDATTDLSVKYRKIKDLRERAAILATLSTASDAYQSGMADLRGILREMYIDHQHPTLTNLWSNKLCWFSGVACLLVLILAIVLMVAYDAEFKRRYGIR